MRGAVRRRRSEAGCGLMVAALAEAGGCARGGRCRTARPGPLDPAPPAEDPRRSQALPDAVPPGRRTGIAGTRHSTAPGSRSPAMAMRPARERGPRRRRRRRLVRPAMGVRHLEASEAVDAPPPGRDGDGRAHRKDPLGRVPEEDESLRRRAPTWRPNGQRVAAARAIAARGAEPIVPIREARHGAVEGSDGPIGAGSQRHPMRATRHHRRAGSDTTEPDTSAQQPDRGRDRRSTTSANSSGRASSPGTRPRPTGDPRPTPVAAPDEPLLGSRARAKIVLRRPNLAEERLEARSASPGAQQQTDAVHNANP